MNYAICHASITLTKDVFFCTVWAVTNPVEGTQSAQFVFRGEGRGAYSKIVAFDGGRG